MYRVLLLCAACCMGAPMACAQEPMVQEKHLLVALGAGAGWASYSGGEDSLDLAGVGVGHIHFSFGYALSKRFSLGVRYGRTGTDNMPEAYALARTTSYQLLLSYRPVVSARGSLEMDLGVGSGIAAMRRSGSRIPERAVAGEATLGLRYMRLLSPTVGWFVRAETSHSSDGPLSIDDVPIKDDAGTAFLMNWEARTLSTGVLVRF